MSIKRNLEDAKSVVEAVENSLNDFDFDAPDKSAWENIESSFESMKSELENNLFEDAEKVVNLVEEIE